MPDIRILILTTFPDGECVFPAFRAGADGYPLKDIPPKELEAGILAVTRGGSPVAPVVARKMISVLAQPGKIPAAVPAGLLSDQKREVLCLPAQGAAAEQCGSLDIGVAEL